MVLEFLVSYSHMFIQINKLNISVKLYIIYKNIIYNIHRVLKKAVKTHI